MHHLTVQPFIVAKVSKKFWYHSIVYSVLFPLLQFKCDCTLVLDIVTLKDALIGLDSLVVLYTAFLKVSVSLHNVTSFPMFEGSTFLRTAFSY